MPGESFLEVLDALPEVGIRVVATRHEGGAAFMAEAVGSLTGQPAACLATRAVGGANLAIGIHTAYQNSTPMVTVLGQVKRSLRGREAFQEVELDQTIGGLAKWAAELRDSATAAELVGEGLRAMVSGRPGPVLFATPSDILAEDFDGRTPDVRPVAPPLADERAVAEAVSLLAGASRPLIIAGGGVLRARATDQLLRFAELLGVPVMAAWRRPDVFPNDHPLYLGMTGLDTPASVLPRLMAADALLVIGCRLNEMTSFTYRIPADDTRWAHVDLQPRVAHAGLRAPDLAVAADAGAFLEAASRAVAAAAQPAHPERAAQNAQDRAAFELSRVVDGGAWTGPGVHPGKAVTTLQRVLPADAILTTDAGNFNGWIARGYRFGQPGTFLGPTSGAMGYGITAGIAASLCHPRRPVVAMCGDGGAAMVVAEMETAVREGASPLVLVFDNNRYGTIAARQLRAGTPLVGTELGPIDFAAVARACGARGGRITRDSELEPALRDALAAGGPALLHLALDPSWVSVDQSPVS